MSTKEDLLEKLFRKPTPKNFTTRELDALMSQCDCQKFPGGRGSSVGYMHRRTGRIVQFDGPHPGNELYAYQVKMIRDFLKEVGELKPEE